MTFQLLPDIAPFVTAFLVLGALPLVVAVVAAGAFLVRNRRQRHARHQSIVTYYRSLDFAY